MIRAVRGGDITALNRGDRQRGEYVAGGGGIDGCTFWFDVDRTSRIVKAVGYRRIDTQCSPGPFAILRQRCNDQLCSVKPNSSSPSLRDSGVSRRSLVIGACSRSIARKSKNASGDVVGTVNSKNGFGAYRQQGRSLEDGSYELRIPYRDSPELLIDVFRHGAHARVMEPELLVQTLKREIEGALRRY